MQICHGRRSTEPSNGATGWPCRSMIHPRAGAPSCSMVTGPGSASVRNTRTTRPRSSAARPTPRRRRRAARRRSRAGVGCSAAGRAGALERHQHRVGGRVAVGRRASRPRGAAPRTRRAGAPGSCAPATGIVGPGGLRPQRRLRAGEVADRSQQRERELAAVVDHLVLEQAVVHECEPDGAVGRVDEPARTGTSAVRTPARRPRR